MFSTKLCRVTRAATPSSAAAITPCTAAATHLPTKCWTTRPGHQRRQSSSKTSCPPDNGGKPAPAAKASATATTDGAAPVPQQKKARKARSSDKLHRLVSERVNGRNGKAGLTDQYAALPRVPDVQHLNKTDIDLASFFSLHRPMSVTKTIPPPSSAEAFNQIFEAQHRPDPWANGNSAQRKPEDVIYTLHNTIEALDGAQESEGVRWEVMQESPSHSESGTKHLDGPPQPRLRSLEELVSQFRPFRAPPPPEPFPSEHGATAEKKASQPRQRLNSRPQQKRYQTTIEVLELTDANGAKSYSASSSPIVRLPDVAPEEADRSSTAVQEPLSAPHTIRMPFLERMRRRQQRYLHAQRGRILERADEPRRIIRRASSAKRIQMLLISVKRQRKLKMKKHKYKKLMKRTRNLRRRLDRT